MDPSITNANTAVAIKNSRIVWVGDQSGIGSWLGKDTQTINLKGMYVYPGFIETHMHVLYTGVVSKYLQLHDCREKSSVISKIKNSLCNYQKDEWIFGIGWDDHDWPQKTDLHATDLDAIAPDNPVVLFRCDTHMFWVNSVALKLGGIDKNTPQPDGGKIEKDYDGNPTGILLDKAMQIIHRIIPTRNLKEDVQAIQNTLSACLKKGITSIHNAATDTPEYEAFKQLAADKQLKTRVYLMGAIRNYQETAFLQDHPQIYSPFLQLRCLKLWMDGALGSRGAALFEPYADDKDNCGFLLWEEEELLSVLHQAKKKGFQIAIHAIGDRANHKVLNAYEKVGVNGLRWRIEHAQQIAQSDIKRFAQMQIIAAMQPLHATADMAWINDRLGEKRVESGAFLWKTLLKNNVIVVGGSDAPVADPNPLLGIYAAITRQNSLQLPKNGWTPKEKVTAEEALKMYTIHAAYACFSENELGSITPGKLADLVVLPENLLHCEPEAMLKMEVAHTIVNGEIVF